MMGSLAAAAIGAVVLRRKRRVRMFRQSPRIIVIGGQCRGVGKTALVADLIRMFAECDWLAVKITQHHAEKDDSAGYRFLAEAERAGNSDTSRYLAAGAARSFLLQVNHAHFGEAMTELMSLMQGAENVIIESNAVLEFIPATLAIFVLDPRRGDFKASARRLLGAADAFVLRWPLFVENWRGVDVGMMRTKPCFLQPVKGPMPISLRRLVHRALGK